MKFCALLACKNRDFKNKKTSGIKHHVFPYDDAKREQWISFVNKFNRTSGWTTIANKGAYLCEDHFEKDLYSQSGRLSLDAVPTKGSQFTAERAFGLKLIASRHHCHLLNRLNDFDKVWPPQDEEEITPDVQPQNEMSSGDREDDKIIIDMPMSPLEDLERTLSADSLAAPLVEVLRIDHMKENVPPDPLMECESHFDSDENQPLIRQGSSFDSMKMNTSAPKLFLTPIANRKRKYYVGDLNASDFDTKEKAEKTLGFVKCRFVGLRRHVRAWRQRCYRYKLKIKNLEELLQHLEEKKNLQPEVSSILKVTEGCHCNCHWVTQLPRD